MEVLVGNLMKAYAQSIDTLSWMSPATKKAAQDKLSKYMLKIGYPNKWRDYGGLEIKRDDLAGNIKRGSILNTAACWPGWASRWTARSGA